MQSNRETAHHLGNFSGNETKLRSGRYFTVYPIKHRLIFQQTKDTKTAVVCSFMASVKEINM